MKYLAATMAGVNRFVIAVGLLSKAPIPVLRVIATAVPNAIASLTVWVDYAR